MNVALIAYIILWGAMIILYHSDILIIIGGLLILVGMIIEIWRDKRNTPPIDKYAAKKKKYKNKKD